MRCPRSPTFAEQGLKDQEADTLTGLVAPAGTPKEIVDLLQREIAKAVAQPDVKEKLAHARLPCRSPTSRRNSARASSAEIEKWGKVVRDAKLRVE